MVKAGRKMKKLLVISQGGVREVELGQEMTIGRAYTNLLRLEGEEVSRVHAILYKRDEEYLIRDLDSKNGVYLNGQRVTSSLVVPGDEIQIGNYILLFDPPADFDLSAFLSQRSLKGDSAEKAVEKKLEKAEKKEAKKPSAAAIAVVAREDETDERFETSIHFVPQPLTQVFYELAEIEELSQTDALSPSGTFTAELIRALRTLTARRENGAEEGEPYQRVLEAAIAATHADRGVLVLREGQGDALRLGAIFPRDRDVSVTRVVLRAVLREKRVVLCNDAKNDPRFQQTDTVQRENITSLIGFPLVMNGHTVGLLYVDTQGRPNAFRREHLVIVHFLSRICTLTMKAAESSRQLQ
ncbi:MAG: FHA domain-containing protein [Candidatus Sumerlaeaceae bacterium]